MHVDPHSLTKDFPDKCEELRRLRQMDASFARLVEDYEALDKRICRIEGGTENMDDLQLNALKQERVVMKDDIARQLRRALDNGGGG
ncbi:YdcH family protein [Azotobacter armeniacus]